MPRRPLGVLSIGVLIVVLAISAFIFAPDLSAIFSFALILFGLWIMILAGIRASNPETYGHGAFNIFSGGVLITALGTVWFLYLRGLLVGYIPVLLLLVVGILVVVAGIRAWRK